VAKSGRTKGDCQETTIHFFEPNSLQFKRFRSLCESLRTDLSSMEDLAKKKTCGAQNGTYALNSESFLQRVIKYD